MTEITVTGAGGISASFTLPVTISDAIVVPPPEPHPSGPDPIQIGNTLADSFEIQLRADATQGTVLMRLPYAYALTGGAGWLPGDRDGYRAGYCFLYDQSFRSAANPEGIIGRAGFFGGYDDAIDTVVFDERMAEAERWYDGTVYTGTNRELNDAPRYEGHGVLELPYWKGAVRYFDRDTGHIYEVRPYEHLEWAPETEMVVVDHITEPFDDPGQVTDGLPVTERVILSVHYKDLEAHTIYYDSFNDKVRLSVHDTADPV